MVVVSCVYSDSSVYEVLSIRTFLSAEFKPDDVFDILFNLSLGYRDEISSGFITTDCARVCPLDCCFLRIQDIDYQEPGTYVRFFYLDELMDDDFFTGEFSDYLSSLSPDSEENSGDFDLFRRVRR